MNTEDFHKKQQNKSQNYSKQAEKDFLEFMSYITKLDPIKLLSQLTLTFLFAPESQLVGSRQDREKWLRYIEFISALLLSKEYPKQPKLFMDGIDIDKIEELLDSYFKNISWEIITSVPDDSKDKDFKSVIDPIKLHSLYVRGEAYSQHLLQMAEELYSEHNGWFKNNLGFTIKEAIEISQSITNKYERRVNEERGKSIKQAEKYADEQIKNGKIEEKDRKFCETQKSWYSFYGNSDRILSFTLEELSKFSGYPKEKCEKYLNRLSQTFGYKNPAFPDTFKNPHSAPWDYNTLCEKPIIFYKGKYFVPAYPRFPEVLLRTFYYDLFSDKEYWAKEGQGKYGRWLERKTADCFRKIFPSEEVYLNPEYPNGNEITDVIVLHDRKIFIVQCKTKRLRYESQIGKDYKMLRGDLEKGIKESFEQGVKARDYIVNDEHPVIKVANGNLIIDGKQISDIFLVSVTLYRYQDLATRWANINLDLKLFKDNQYPWAVSLPDLMVITELIDYPSMFIHYIKRRLQVEQTNFQLGGDEIDLLGYYFRQGLYFKTNDFKKVGAVSIYGFSSEIDQYMLEKYELGKNPAKPKQEMPEKFEEYLKTVENLNSSYKMDCAIRLLDLDYQRRKDFINMAEKTKEKTKNDRKLHSFSMEVDNNSLGFSFVAMDANGNVEKLFRTTHSFAVMKKYAKKYKEWVGFGWDSNSQKVLDVAIFLSFEPFKDPELDKMAKENLRKGKLVDLGKEEQHNT